MSAEQDLIAVSHAQPWSINNLSPLGTALERMAAVLRAVSEDPGWSGKAAQSASHKYLVDSKRVLRNADRVSQVALELERANLILEGARNAHAGLIDTFLIDDPTRESAAEVRLAEMKAALDDISSMIVALVGSFELLSTRAASQPFSAAHGPIPSTASLTNGYSHSYQIHNLKGLTRKQIFERIREHFGKIFVPLDNQGDTARRSKLIGVGQIIHTQLEGVDLPGVTSGDIEVTRVSATGYTIAALPGHPEYPGQVSFTIGGTDSHPTLDVVAKYRTADFGVPPPVYNAATYLLWDGMAANINNVIEGETPVSENYGAYNP